MDSLCPCVYEGVCLALPCREACKAARPEPQEHMHPLVSIRACVCAWRCPAERHAKLQGQNHKDADAALYKAQSEEDKMNRECASDMNGRQNGFQIHHHACRVLIVTCMEDIAKFGKMGGRRQSMGDGVRNPCIAGCVKSASAFVLAGEGVVLFLFLRFG
eukprot:scaffold12764_cov20-Tisochrysis_lutea.AAC.4